MSPGSPGPECTMPLTRETLCRRRPATEPLPRGETARSACSSSSAAPAARIRSATFPPTFARTGGAVEFGRGSPLRAIRQSDEDGQPKPVVVQHRVRADHGRWPPRLGRRRALGESGESCVQVGRGRTASNTAGSVGPPSRTTPAQDPAWRRVRAVSLGGAAETVEAGLRRGRWRRSHPPPAGEGEYQRSRVARARGGRAAAQAARRRAPAHRAEPGRRARRATRRAQHVAQVRRARHAHDQ